MNRPETDADFAAYVDARRATLIRALVLTGCSLTEAEDQVQAALLRCYRSWHRVQSARNPDAYVFRVLFNTVKESRTRRWWGEQPVAAVPAPRPDGTDPAEQAAVGHTVRQVLSAMNRDHSAVLVLRFFADLPERAVAEILGVPIGTVKSRTARALQQLADNAELAEIYREGSS